MPEEQKGQLTLRLLAVIDRDIERSSDGDNEMA